MAEYFKRSDVEKWIEEICDATESDTEYVLSRIDEINPADVVEVVGGEWKNKGNFEDLNPTNFEMYECSVCRRWLSVGEVSSDYFKNHYKCCPMCGARMDGGT